VVVSTHLKNIRLIGLFPEVEVKNPKNIWVRHHPELGFYGIPNPWPDPTNRFFRQPGGWLVEGRDEFRKKLSHPNTPLKTGASFWGPREPKQLHPWRVQWSLGWQQKWTKILATVPRGIMSGPRCLIRGAIFTAEFLSCAFLLVDVFACFHPWNVVKSNMGISKSPDLQGSYIYIVKPPLYVKKIRRINWRDV